MNDVIEVNAGYKLVGRMREMPRKMCFVCGRQGDTISLLLVNGVIRRVDPDGAMF